MSDEDVNSLQEMFDSEGWRVYVDDKEATMVRLFRELFLLEPTKPESFIKFVELKSRIDQLRDETYMYELQTNTNGEQVEESYGNRFSRMLAKLFKRS